MERHGYIFTPVLIFLALYNPVLGQCPDKDLASAQIEDPTRTCKKECIAQADCTGESKKCRCDDLCGMSCFNPDAECPDIETFSDGDIRFPQGRKYDHRAIHTCNNAYYLTGVRERICRSTREWSHTAPNCTLGCPPPANRGNGFANADAEGYKPGDVVTYECRTGYIGTGNFDVTCRDDLTWTAVGFVCQIVNCGHPGDIDNGRLNGTEFTFGSTVTYVCNTGFEMSGPPVRRCFSEGNWDPEVALPTCSAMPCRPPVDLENGVTDKTSAVGETFGQIVYYSCSVGYKLIGPVQGTCNENGTWGEVPMCKVDLDCDFENSGTPICGYTRISGTFLRQRVDEDKDGLLGFVLSGNGVLRLLAFPLNGTHKVCMEAYFKNTQEDALKAEAFKGTSTKLLQTMPASSTWSSVKFWLTTVNPADTDVQLQFTATSDVLLDKVKELSASECASLTTTTSTTTVSPTETSTRQGSSQDGQPTTSPTGATTTKNEVDPVPPGGLPAGVIAAIVIAVFLGVVVLGVLVSWLAGYNVFQMFRSDKVDGSGNAYIKGDGNNPEKIEIPNKPANVPTTEV